MCGIASGRTLSSKFAGLVDHDELGDEHPRLARAVHDLVVEVVDLAASLAGDVDRLDAKGLEREVENPDPFLISRQERRVDHLDVERRPVMRDRDRMQLGDELGFGDRVRGLAAIPLPALGTTEARLTTNRQDAASNPRFDPRAG